MCKVRAIKAIRPWPLLHSSYWLLAERQDTYLAVDHCLFSFYDCFGNQLPLTLCSRSIDGGGERASSARYWRGATAVHWDRLIRGSSRGGLSHVGRGPPFAARGGDRDRVPGQATRRVRTNERLIPYNR